MGEGNIKEDKQTRSTARNMENKTNQEVRELYRSLDIIADINPLNAELNTICNLLALLGAHHILHVSRIRVNKKRLQ